MKRSAPFPPITDTEPTRLPRVVSDDWEARRGDSGCCLIALAYQGKRLLTRYGSGKSKGRSRGTRAPRVLVRNVYHSHKYGPMVENIREYVPKQNAGYTGQQGKSLKFLLALPQFKLMQAPFRVKESMPNCMVEMNRNDWHRVWASNRDKPAPGSVEAHFFMPEETPTLRLLKLHWAGQRLHDRWTSDRVARLCALWGLTPHELAELIQWSHGHMDHLMKTGEGIGSRFIPGPVAVWFTFLENFKLGIPTFPQFTSEEAKAS